MAPVSPGAGLRPSLSRPRSFVLDGCCVCFLHPWPSFEGSTCRSMELGPPGVTLVILRSHGGFEDNKEPLGFEASEDGWFVHCCDSLHVDARWRFSPPLRASSPCLSVVSKVSAGGPPVMRTENFSVQTVISDQGALLDLTSRLP
ncbi:hypothetical protein GQ457_04G016570 [Hibiscus cannabinus]